MKSKDMQAALQAFLQNNPDLPQGEDRPAETEKNTALPRLIVRLETKGRKGKPATIISGLPADSIDKIAAELKRKLATGGSYRDDEILIQGDRRTDVTAALRAMGFKTN